MLNESDNTPLTIVPSKRPRSPNEVSSQGDDWLSVVLNDVEVDPRIDNWNYYFQDSYVSRHKTQNPEITFTTTTPFIFKPVNPALVNGVESNNSQRRQESFNLSSFSTNFLSEDLVGKVVEVLGVVLEEVKSDIWRTIINVNKDHLIPASFLREFNKLVNDSPFSQPNNIKTPFIKCVEEFRSFISRMHLHYSLSPEVELFRNALNFYCQMTSFVTVVHMLFDAVVMDFLCENNEEVPMRRLSVENFMNIFHHDDNFLEERNMPFDDQPPNTGENLEAFTWYYRSIVRSQPQYQCDLSDRFHSLAIQFTTLEQIESILSILYTKHFLNALAKEQQKDHGQFYTPREVMRFMWDRVLGKEIDIRIEKLLGGPFQNPNLYPNNTLNSSSTWGVLPQAPSVLDPCMGIGSFLCEFISRLTCAAQQCPIVWNNPRAISSLLHSLSVNLWGIEIDAFAYHLCKINITLHILPLYKRFLQLATINDLKLARFHLFCNDTLNLYLPKEHTWEFDNLKLLRSPQRLKFDFIVTNPPYMIRKTGFISEPDSELFDERVLGKGGMQAYAYFFWFCIERCREETGEVCLISASQWMGLEFADKLRAWIWQKCHLVEFFQFEPFKVWRKIQTDSLIFRLRRRSEPILSTSVPSTRPALTEPILFLRYMNRKASLQETLQAYSTFNPNVPQFEKDMHFKLSPPYPITQLPSSTNSYSFTFLMPSSAVSAYLHSITAHFPSLCDHASMKHTWVENNPLIWHRGPNTTPVYALVVRTAWAYSKFGPDVCRRWLRPVFYWNGKNGGKEAEFWQKMGDELRLEKKENSPAEAYVPFISNNNGGSITKDGLEQDKDKSMYSLIMVDRDAVDKVRSEFSENSEFWKYLKEARKYLQTGMTSREVAYCGTSKCGIDAQTKIIHPINYGYFSKHQPRQRFFIDEDNVCVTNQCIYFTVKTTTRLPPYFFLGMLNSTTIQHFLSHHCKYDQQGRMRLFRENMAKIPYAAPTDSEGVNWFIRCVQRMILVRQMLYEGIRACGEEEKVASAVVEKLRRGAWQLTGREWQEKESSANNDETNVVLREEQEGNWVMVKQCRGRGEGVEYSLCPGSEQVPGHDEMATEQTSTFHNFSSAAEVTVLNDHRTPSGSKMTKTHILKPFFESLLYASACLQYAIDQYTYSLYGIDKKFQMALEDELKLELFEAILNKYPRLNGTVGSVNGNGNVETKGIVPEWGERLYEEVEMKIEEGRNLLQQKRTILHRGYKNLK